MGLWGTRRRTPTKTGSGTYVSDPKLRRSDAADINILTERMDTLITRGLNLGLESEDIIAMFKARIDKFVSKPKAGRGKND